MSDRKEDLRDAKTNSDPSVKSDPPVNFGYNELLAELTSEMPTEMDETTEVCVPFILRQNPGASEYAIGRLLRTKLASGEYTWRWAMWKGQRVKAYHKA